MITRSAALYEIDQRWNCVFEPDTPPSLGKVFSAKAAKFRIVPNQISQLASLLNQIGSAKPRNALLKSGYSEQFAQHQAGILEAQRLIKIGSQQDSFVRLFISSKHALEL